MDVVQEETLVHCIAHGNPVQNGETVYVLRNEEGENIGVVCGACMGKIHDGFHEGNILIFKGITVPGITGVAECYAVGIPAGSTTLNALRSIQGK